jgi:hypothetical protein
LFLCAPGTRLLGGNSHAEWVQKTASAGSNWEIFCFDCGNLAKAGDLRAPGFGGQMALGKGAFNAA